MTHAIYRVDVHPFVLPYLRIMSDTPETNNGRRVCQDDSLPKYVVSADLAEKLERERNEAKSALLEIYEAMRLYESDVDGEAPSRHYRMMERVRSVLFKENNQDREPTK